MFMSAPFTAPLANAIIVRPEEQRTYFLIQNTHPTSQLLVGIGYEPNADTGIIIGPNGYYEPIRIPQNEIWVRGVGVAACTGVVLYATEN